MRSEHPELGGPAKRCLGALDTVSWPWVPVLGSLEPPRQDGENAQKTGGNGGEMGEIRSKRCEGVGITWLASACAPLTEVAVAFPQAVWGDSSEDEDAGMRSLPRSPPLYQTR